MTTLTPAQEAALDRLWERDENTVLSNLAYEREYNTKLHQTRTTPFWPSREAMNAKVRDHGDCVMIEWRGMWLGIEPDGYTHS